jgi:small-conductance mechanosensitive channel
MNNRLLQLLAFGFGVATWLLIKPVYNDLTALTDLPELFEHSFYRTFLAILITGLGEHVLLFFYQPENPSRNKDNFTIGVGFIARILYGFWFVALVMSLFNITVKEALTTLSLIAAALVLMTKDYISNVINGMYMTFTRFINIDDEVSINNSKGKIMDITLTNVQLLNEDDDIVYIPNNKIFSVEIINYTRRSLKKSSIDFQIDPAIIHDINHLESRLWNSIHDFHADIQPETYSIKVVEITMDRVNLKIQYILIDPLNKYKDREIKRFIKRKIIELLYEHVR